MELKYISSHKLLIYYGIIGIIIYAFVCLLLSFIRCNVLLEDSVCEIFDDKGNYYIENIFIYFYNLSKSNIETIILEIIMFYKSEFCERNIMYILNNENNELFSFKKIKW